MKHLSITGLLSRALLVAALAASPAAPAFADAVPGMDWTSVGSAGTVDEADLNAVFLDGARASHIGAAGRTVRIRYNVVAVDGLSGVGITMRVRYNDNGPARVLVALKRYSFDTSATDTLLTFDSDTVPSSLAFETGQVETCAGGFDFTRNAYFIDVQLLRTSTSFPLPGQAQLGAIQVTNRGVC
jgi:hypothetical protein